jgi:hypothetical protein
MEEHQNFQRHHVLKAAIISINSIVSVDCTVQSLSSAGACLDVANSFGIPENFILVIRNYDVRQPCPMAWRNEKLIGVAFKSSGPDIGF